MTRPRKLHIIAADELRAGVLNGTATTALCGRRRVRTRADIDVSRDVTLPVCKKCADALAELAKTSDILVRERKGWEQFEKETRPTTKVTVRITTTGSHARWDFPLAG